MGPSKSALVRALTPWRGTSARDGGSMYCSLVDDPHFKKREGRCSQRRLKLLVCHSCHLSFVNTKNVEETLFQHSRPSSNSAEESLTSLTNEEIPTDVFIALLSSYLLHQEVKRSVNFHVRTTLASPVTIIGWLQTSERDVLGTSVGGME